MKTSIVPPHDMPTSKASSSAIPYVTVLGLPVSITSCAWRKTSFSTHPPLTEPSMSPVDETRNFEPSGRGALPWTLMTVATATSLPSSTHLFRSAS